MRRRPGRESLAWEVCRAAKANVLAGSVTRITTLRELKQCGENLNLRGFFLNKGSSRNCYKRNVILVVSLLVSSVTAVSSGAVNRTNSVVFETGHDRPMEVNYNTIFTLSGTKFPLKNDQRVT